MKQIKLIFISCTFLLLGPKIPPAFIVLNALNRDFVAALNVKEKFHAGTNQQEELSLLAYFHFLKKK
jgi:hypothetical protein